jgi:hypothetical protein
MLETRKCIVNEGDLRPLPQLEPLGLVLVMQGVDVCVVGVQGLGADVGLQLDDVRVWDVLRVGRRQERGSIVVDGAGAEERVGVGTHAEEEEGGDQHDEARSGPSGEKREGRKLR